jgi:hypothetical protein
MLSGRPHKYIAFAAITMVAVIGGSYAYLSYSLRHMQFDLSGLDLLVKRTTATVEIATLTVPRCASSADFLPAGDRKREATMLYVATIIDLYKSTFGKMPETIDDLDKLPSFHNADRLNGSEVKKSCSLRGHPGGSYVLSCGALMPPAKEVDALFRKAEHAQRFYMVSGTETLYVPEKACS